MDSPLDNNSDAIYTVLVLRAVFTPTNAHAFDCDKGFCTIVDHSLDTSHAMQHSITSA